jgi:sulfonate transport system ATP-binding protein
MATVLARGLTRDFDDERVLDGLDIDIDRGEFVALLGRSGSGKSTLLKALAGLDTRVEGRITIEGTVGVAFQEPRLLPWKRLIDNIRLAGPKADEALREVGLHGKERAWPLTLSGGEAQRAALARALVREPDLLLLDEPFSALDALTRITIHRLVKDLWARRGIGVLLVTHDVDEALELAGRVLVLDQGRIVHEERVGERPDQKARLLGTLGVVRDKFEGAP